ncbi:MAG: YbhB/YbcL family Raf kinase inhibitor-like protein, partial [Gemmatimonadaceae bacterium]
GKRETELPAQRIPQSRLSPLASRLPLPAARLPRPAHRFPPPASRLPLPASRIGAIGAATFPAMRTRECLGVGILSLSLLACERLSRSTPADTLAIATDSARGPHQTRQGRKSMPLRISSTAFGPNGPIPSKYTCEGADTSPPLEWSGAPDGTRSFALIVDDPDAPDPAKPKMVYVHWVIYNIPSSKTKLAENAAKTGLPEGALQGINDWKKPTWGGPCPPIGRHRYFFKLYALDTQLSLSNPSKTQLEKAMLGHTLGNAEIIGTYQKSKP